MDALNPSRNMLDVMAVRATGDPEKAVKKNLSPSNPQDRDCDILIVGGGVGGSAAALSAASLGHNVCLAEETDWLGGQFTAQGVSAFDEHEYIESSGGTRSYYQLRNGIRGYYRKNHEMSTEAEREEFLNPGGGWVSRLCFEPKVGLLVLQTLLHPYEEKGLVSIYLRTKIYLVELDLDFISSVLMYRFDSDEWIRFHPKYVLDATELGDVLPLAGAEYVIGAESKSETGEPHAQPGEARPECVQGFTYTFALEQRPGDHTIPKPPGYENHRDQQPYRLGLYVHGGTIYSEESGWLNYKVLSQAEGTRGSFWSYRRLVDHTKFPKSFAHDIAMFNWPGNDYRDRGILDKSPSEQARALQEAKAVSLGMLYWLQKEAPRDEGGTGYPEFMLRKDIMETEDGLSKYPYIRESRRIKALKTILEQEISEEFQSGSRAQFFRDSVGIGLYPIDIHPCGDKEVGVSLRAKPFQIPMGSLIPLRIKNLLAAAKNIGTTHITNGAYRLHPVEWNIGESAGALAAFAIEIAKTPREIHQDEGLRLKFQEILLKRGIPLYWFIDLPLFHPSFHSVQLLAVIGAIQGSRDHLLYLPDEKLTIKESPNSDKGY